ncbi:hypothetical protein DVH05_002494 [Phytophthora capsici]|nr:hypothetical protein DVH05_002494 [Phytophthora capsici]
MTTQPEGLELDPGGPGFHPKLHEANDETEEQTTLQGKGSRVTERKTADVVQEVLMEKGVPPSVNTVEKTTEGEEPSDARQEGPRQQQQQYDHLDPGQTDRCSSRDGETEARQETSAEQLALALQHCT